MFSSVSWIFPVLKELKAFLQKNRHQNQTMLLLSNLHPRTGFLGSFNNNNKKSGLELWITKVMKTPFFHWKRETSVDRLLLVCYQTNKMMRFLNTKERPVLFSTSIEKWKSRRRLLEQLRLHKVAICGGNTAQIRRVRRFNHGLCALTEATSPQWTLSPSGPPLARLESAG